MLVLLQVFRSQTIWRVFKVDLCEQFKLVLWCACIRRSAGFSLEDKPLTVEVVELMIGTDGGFVLSKVVRPRPQQWWTYDERWQA